MELGFNLEKKVGKFCIDGMREVQSRFRHWLLLLCCCCFFSFHIANAPDFRFPSNNDR